MRKKLGFWPLVSMFYENTLLQDESAKIKEKEFKSRSFNLTQKPKRRTNRLKFSKVAKLKRRKAA